MEKPFFDSDKLQVEVFSLDDSTFESSELSFLNQNLEKFDQIFPETTNHTPPLTESITPSQSIAHTSPKFKEFSNDIDQIFSEFDREVSRILTPTSIDSTDNIQDTPHQDTPYAMEELQTDLHTENLDISGFSFKEPDNTDNFTDEPILEESNYIDNDIDNDVVDIVDEVIEDIIIEESNEVSDEIIEEVVDKIIDEIIVENNISFLDIIDDIATDDVIDNDVDNNVDDIIIEESNEVTDEVAENMIDDVIVESDISFLDIIDDIATDDIATDDVIDNDVDNDVDNIIIEESNEVTDEVVEEEELEEIAIESIDNDVDNDAVDNVESNEVTVENDDVIDNNVDNDVVDNVESNEVTEVVEESEMQRMGISPDMLSQLNSVIPSSSGGSFTRLSKDEVRELMINIDNLLEFLPEEKIEELSQQDFYHDYIKFLDDLGV